MPSLERQEDAADPEKHNPENFYFKHNDVAFFGINEVNRNRAEHWTGQDARNVAWLESKFGTNSGGVLDCSFASVVIFSQRGVHSSVESALSNYFAQCGGDKPVLNITGDIHPFVYCSNTNTDNNILKITVEAFKAAPLMVSILKDLSDGQHYFHMESTSTSTIYGNCATFP